MNKEPKILALRLSSLGDIILTLPVYRNIKEKWPNCYLAIVVKPQFADAVKGHPCIDEVICFEGYRKTLKKIRSKNFTHLIDLHASFRTFIITRLAGIKSHIKYQKDSIARRLFVKLRIPSPALDRHVLDRYLDVLRKWDIPVVYKEPLLADWDLNPKEKGQKKKGQTICIYQTAFLGDAVLTLPLVEKTAEEFPDAKIIVVTRPDTADVFKNSAKVARVITDDKKRSPFITGVRRMARRIKALKANIIIIPHRSFRSALIAFLARVPVRVGFTSSAGRFLLNRRVPFSWLLHDAERNLSLLTPIIGEGVQAKPIYMEEDKHARKTIDNIFSGSGVGKNTSLIGIHAGSAWFTKRWPLQNFARLIAEMTDDNTLCVLVGGKADAYLAAKISEITTAKVINLMGKTNIPELMSVMPRLKLFITNDSGPMHIATAFNVPTIAIFGPTTKELGFFPYGEGHRVIEKQLKCRPCALHGGKKCPHGHFLCMRLITPKEVIDAAKQMLNGNTKREQKNKNS